MKHACCLALGCFLNPCQHCGQSSSSTQLTVVAIVFCRMHASTAFCLSGDGQEPLSNAPLTALLFSVYKRIVHTPGSEPCSYDELPTQIKLAYESILQHEAGYRPPPPGSAPNAHYAEAYWHAHSADGRVPWGQFAGAWGV
jgi:hypothetical protein